SRESVDRLQPRRSAMATEAEFNELIDALPDEEFEALRSSMGGDSMDAYRKYYKLQFNFELSRDRDAWYKRFGFPTRGEKLTRATIEVANSAAISARTAEESALAAKTLARLAEEASASARRSAWKFLVAFVISAIPAAIQVGQYIRSFNKP